MMSTAEEDDELRLRLRLRPRYGDLVSRPRGNSFPELGEALPSFGTKFIADVIADNLIMARIEKRTDSITAE
jgi:hypothetical protein